MNIFIYRYRGVRRYIDIYVCMYTYVSIVYIYRLYYM